MNKHITAAANATVADKPRRLRIVNNAALTGTLTVTDVVAATPSSAAVTDTIAVITNPGVGDTFNYGQFRGVAKVEPSTTCDITVVTE